MDSSLKSRIKNQIFKFEANIVSAQDSDSAFTLDFEKCSGQVKTDTF